MEQLGQLIAFYREHIGQYRAQSYNETEVRSDFVNPFFELLGWDVANRKRLPQHLREVKQEASVFVEEDGVRKKKKPDYAFYFGSQTCFFLETKKPSVDIVTSREAAFQLRRYGWNGNLRISVLTNFTDLLIYDCTVRPRQEDDVFTALVARYHYTEYEERWEEIRELLSREAVVTGAFEKRLERLAGPVKKEPFNEYFLEKLKEWRQRLSEDLWARNPGVGEENLNICAQRILNRIIFLRILEDRNLERYEALKEADTEEALVRVFREADKKYDSGLFSLLEDGDIQVSAPVLRGILEDLYYPKSCFEFSVVEPYMIGQIYELFLEEQLCPEPDGTLRVRRKPEAVASQGVVNTPKNMADRIVRETLDGLLGGKTPEQARAVRIADISCGSGNFLLSAFEYLINRRTEELSARSEQALREGLLLEDEEGGLRLSFAERRGILKRNLFGVDIDPLAAEVTKLSLLLKLIEGCTRRELADYAREKHTGILPDLDENVQTGNALVDTGYLKYDRTFLEKPELYRKLRLYDWGGRKFDAIIGNPPYIRVQNMVHYSREEYEYYKSGKAPYETADSGLLDKYYLFLEKGWELLEEGGRLGYIVPHKFMLLKTGNRLREFLAGKACVSKILHLGTQQVFQGRSTYTCLLFLDKKPHERFSFGEVSDLNAFYAGEEPALRTYPMERLSGAPWSFGEERERLFDGADGRCAPLKELADIFVGLQTSKDTVYILQADEEDEEYVYFTDMRGRKQKVERGILKPCIYDLSLERYRRIAANRYLIFPYREAQGTVTLYSRKEMEEKFPWCYAYLSGFRGELDKRSIPKRTEENWFQFGRSQSLKRFAKGERLLWPVLSLGANYVYDDLGIAFTGGGNGPYYGLMKKKQTKESIYYIQAVLNSGLLERMVKSRASTFRGDYYSHGKQFIQELPIYRIDFSNPAEARFHEDVTKRVQGLMELKRRQDAEALADGRKLVGRLIRTEEEELDKMIERKYTALEKSLGGGA